MHGHERIASLAEQYSRTTQLGSVTTLPGPTGERNTLTLSPRGAVACAAGTLGGLLNQLAATLSTGNIALLPGAATKLLPNDLPPAVKDRIRTVASLDDCEFQIALVESMLAKSLHGSLAARSGALVSLISTNEDSSIPLWRLLAERALCVNTTAAGGNASLMTLQAS
jgi:RHH-type proline utilization regulon transcriptional repressor/proline dehydrogenase/delta 1-pyrroline-5-carboxylate dehydrogenase